MKRRGEKKKLAREEQKNVPSAHLIFGEKPMRIIYPPHITPKERKGGIHKKSDPHLILLLKGGVKFYLPKGEEERKKEKEFRTCEHAPFLFLGTRPTLRDGRKKGKRNSERGRKKNYQLFLCHGGKEAPSANTIYLVGGGKEDGAGTGKKDSTSSPTGGEKRKTPTISFNDLKGGKKRGKLGKRARGGRQMIERVLRTAYLREEKKRRNEDKKGRRKRNRAIWIAARKKKKGQGPPHLQGRGEKQKN